MARRPYIAAMAVEAVELLSDDAVHGLFPALEQAFGVRFPPDLRHLRTAGDLFEQVLALRPATRGGEAQPAASMAFFALRRILAPLWAEPEPNPSTPLRGQGLPLPRKLRRIIAQKLGYDSPPLTLSIIGMLLAGAIATVGLVLLLGGGREVTGALLMIAAIAVLALDQGEFSRDWATLGSLAAGIEERNFATLAEAGAASGEADMWRVFARVLAAHVSDDDEPSPGDIGRETLLRFG